MSVTAVCDRRRRDPAPWLEQRAVLHGLQIPEGIVRSQHAVPEFSLRETASSALLQTPLDVTSSQNSLDFCRLA